MVRAQTRLSGPCSTEWAGIRHPSVAHFRDVVLKFRPFALARDGMRWYLALNRRDEEEERYGKLYIESPLRAAVLESCLADRGLAGFDVIREFYTHFNGLRQEPIIAGNFEQVEEWSSLRDIGWDEESFDPEYEAMSAEWLDGLIIFTTRSGDMIVRLADDRMVWALMAENRAVPVATSFSGFLELCAEAYDRYFCLDYYLLN